MPPLTPELRVLAWSVFLFLAHMMLQGFTALREQGVAFNAGPRDDPPKLGRIAGRARRAFDNFKETYPVFLALALALSFSGRSGGAGATGAWLWLFARIVYAPLYLAGVPWLRTLVWAVAGTGLLMMLSRLLRSG